MIDKVELPQGGFHPKMVEARREIESAKEGFKKGDVSERELLLAERKYQLSRLTYDKLDEGLKKGLTAAIHNLDRQIAEKEVKENR